MPPGGAAATSRLARVQQPKPSGRYCYEISSDESDVDEEAAYLHAGHATLHPWSDESSESEGEDEVTRTVQRDVTAIRLANELDPWDKWEQTCRRRAWYTIQHRGHGGTRSRTTTPAPDTGVDEIEEILARFQLQQSHMQKKEREAFEQRNASLWEGIDKAIRNAEKRAAEEAEQLANARKRQEEAEKQAKLAREAELKRMDEEKKAAEARKREEDARKREQEQQQQKELATNVLRGGKHLWPVAKGEYERCYTYMKQVKEDILPSIAKNPDWKKQCFAAKRSITPKVGQLTNTKAEIARITLAIADVLEQARRVPDKDAAYRLYTWMLNHLSKCLIRQAEQEVAARQETAFPLARLVMGLLLREHAQLGDVLMARLVKKCPWILGYVPERGTQQGEEHRKRLGFKTVDETVPSYVARMVGISAFYFACLQTPLDTVAACCGLPPSMSLEQAAQQVPDLLRPGRMWIWQVRSMTSPVAQQAIVVSLWCTFLEVAGPSALLRYKKQAIKVWRLLLDEGLQGKLGAKSGDDVQRAAEVRLRLILETWSSTGTLGEHASPGRDMDP